MTKLPLIPSVTAAELLLRPARAVGYADTKRVCAFPSPKGKELRLQALLVANQRRPVLGSLDDYIAPATQ